MQIRFVRLFLALVAVLTFYAPNAFALGECGLSCCIAGAAGSGITLAESFGVSVQYEYSFMETIKNGKDEVSTDDVIVDNQTPGLSYKVPTEMVMQKISFTGAYPVNERLIVLATVPFVINDMDMRMRSAMGMTMDMTMETVSGLGDVSLLGLYTVHTDAPIRPTKRLTIGAGVKTPTGSTTEKSPSGSLIHAMMQPGTGSWDPLFMVNYMRAYYPLVLQANLFYQWTTEGNNGYEFGDRFTYDLSARYQAWDYLNVGIEVNGFHTGGDDDRDGKYSSPETSMLDNPGFTGLDSVFITPVLQVKIPGTGGSGELKYQVPVYQNVNGYQQVVDWRVFASLSWVF